MQISDRHIDDFKTDRKDIAPPLPVVLRLVPILFYCAIVVTILLSSMFFLQLRLAAANRDNLKAQTATLLAQTQQSKNERAALETQIKKATDIQQWVNGSRPLQPLIVEITRSMAPKASILDLSLSRAPDDPSHIQLSLKMGADSTRQLDQTMSRISSMNFRAFSPSQTLGRGVLEYTATLVRKFPEETAASAQTEGSPR